MIEIQIYQKKKNIPKLMKNKERWESMRKRPTNVNLVYIHFSFSKLQNCPFFSKFH